MSSDLQNKRSPDQQYQEIVSRIERLGYPWTIIKVYRDDAKSGRFIGKRPAYTQMMREIRSHKIKPDFILTDTLERFGRVDDLPSIRKELFEKYGVLVLTADSNFADPNTPQGRALGMVESMRATEHGRILAHNVHRGKRDTVRQKHWPGGKAPLGYRLQTVMRSDRGREEVDHSILVPDPAASGFIQALFAKAAETGWGGTRLAKHFNSDPSLPPELKPLSPTTVTYILGNEIYCGILVWNQNSTDIAADVRVVVPNAPADILRIPEFCDPLVTREVWDQVHRFHEMRRERAARAYAATAAKDSKELKPLAPGMAIKYPLSGLVFCPECGLRMRAMSTGAYVTKAGKTKRYTKYMCPGFASGNCTNGVKIPEEWLRTVVVETILRRLFPGSDAQN